jgi:cell division protein FtsB
MIGRRLIIGLLLIVNLLLGYRLLLSDQGLFAYLDLRERRQELAERIEAEQARGERLSREIRWLDSDAGYQERMIRTQLNYVKPQEVLYIFTEQSGRAQQREREHGKQD